MAAGAESVPSGHDAGAGADTGAGALSGPGRWFEDFRVGECFTSGWRQVIESDLAEFTRLSGDDHPIHTGRDAILQGPYGLAVAMGLLQSLGLHGDSVLGLLDTHWSYRHPIRVGDRLRLRVTIVRTRRTSDGRRGVVTRHMALLDGTGRPVQEGTTAALLAARGQGPDRAGRAFGTVAWGNALVEHLTGEFAESLASWDGTIGLRAGTDEVHLRVYRGKVIEVARRAARGASFTLAADELTWTELVAAEHNEFVRFAMAGRFNTYGDGYEYLRLTSALAALVDVARLVGRDG